MECAEQAAALFMKTPSSRPVKLVSHLDSDGICACSIMADALNRANINYSISILTQLKDDSAAELASEDYEVYIFTDLGSGQIEQINKHFKSKKVFVIDHHSLQGKAAENIVHVNPHLFGIDGSTAISGAGVVYCFCKALNNSQMAHLAVIGAIGDVQEKQGFSGLNTQILEEAVGQGSISVKKGLRFFGLQTRPLHKLLEYSTDLGIPDVTGSESGAIAFLKSVGIEPRIGDQWAKISDLTNEEKKKLVAGIIMKRVNHKAPEDIFANVYNLNHEKPGPFRDAREFSTILNACGRMNKASVGIGACLGDARMKEAAFKVHTEYKREIVNALNWYKNAGDGGIIRNENYMILNAKDSILPTIAGTLGSILSKSRDFKDNFYIMALARNMDRTTKVSLRIVGNPEHIRLNELMLRMVEGIEASEAGGHQHAAGAFIPTGKEQEFIERAMQLLDTVSIEEVVD